MRRERCPDHWLRLLHLVNKAVSVLGLCRSRVYDFKLFTFEFPPRAEHDARPSVEVTQLLNTTPVGFAMSDLWRHFFDHARDLQ
jgi:hypothetical protein